MSDSTSAYGEAADSILEHAQAVVRLGQRDLDGDDYAAALAQHVHAIRLVAAAHVDPMLDRAFFRQLRQAAAQSGALFVLFEDGIVQLVIDSARGQHRFDLLSPAQIERRGYD